MSNVNDSVNTAIIALIIILSNIFTISVSNSNNIKVKKISRVILKV